jgi:hypothetical protein
VLVLVNVHEVLHAARINAHELACGFTEDWEGKIRLNKDRGAALQPLPRSVYASLSRMAGKYTFPRPSMNSFGPIAPTHLLRDTH